MGMTNVLARAATAHAHVLVVEVPARWEVRAALERGLTRRGWRSAVSPADADVLAVCGEPGPELAEVVQRVWDQLPGPRVRVDVHDAGEVEAVLDEAAGRLLHPAAHRADARERRLFPDPGSQSGGEHGEHGEHGEMGDMGDMEMSPDGIALAEGGEDRDGLEMDVLHVRLGPVLPYWPAGLVLRCSLQGDVIVAAEAEVLDSTPKAPPVGAGTSAARDCDHVAALLALAGWTDAAVQARRVRDALLTGSDTAGVVLLLERLRRKVSRSWLLRWSLRLQHLSDAELRAEGLPVHLRGDTNDRLLAMLDRALERLTETSRAVHDDTVSLTSVPRLVTGLDLATARLVVASLGLDDVHAGREATHA